VYTSLKLRLTHIDILCTKNFIYLLDKGLYIKNSCFGVYDVVDLVFNNIFSIMTIGRKTKKRLLY